jgi:polyhydroxyalkanoate synthesis regulator phasin
VADAQDLVSEAMDVAAGKQKSLLTVTEALAKGEQGNTAGLGRLGIATKDAAGHALTFDQISKNLAQTFKGQAATAADTASGKYKIMKTQFSELGESIGYELLPKATEFGDWVLDDGIPAAEQLTHWLGKELGPVVQDLSGWVSDNKDEMQEFGQVVLDDVVGGLKVVVDVGGKVVGFFNGLPDPVKRVGIEVAIAAVAFRQLNNSLSPIGRSLSTFAAGVADAEKRSAALTGAARQAAGVGGLALLVDSAHQSNDALSTLEGTAGAAAAGFAVGGPWGAAIGGAGGLVYELGSKFAMADRKAQNAYDQIAAVDPVKEAERNLADLKDTLDQVTGAYTGATRAAVLQKLEEAGLISVGEKYGLTTRQMIDGAIGQKGAFSALKPVVSDYQGQLETLDAQIKAVKDSNDSYSYGDKDTNVAFRKLTDSATEQVTALEKQKKALQTSLEELKKLPGTLKDDAHEIQATSAATADYTGKLKGIPQSAKTQILTDGLEPTIRAIADLTDHYNLTPKQVRTLIQATGVDASVHQVETLKARIDALRDKTVTVNVQTVHSSAVAHGIGSTVDGSGSQRKLPTGPHDRNAINDAFAGILKASGIRAFSDVMHDPHFADLGPAGSQLLGSLVNGIRDGERPLKNVLDAVTNNLQNSISNWQAQVDQRDQFAASFQAWSTSIFSLHGADEQHPLTIEDLLGHSAQEKAKADTAATDVQKLVGEHLNDALIRQLQAQGADGAEALHVLAGASQAQIDQLNADQVATQKSYADAGLAAANQVYGGLIAQAESAKLQAQALADTVKGLKDFQHALGDVRFILHGDELVAVIDAVQRTQGMR